MGAQATELLKYKPKMDEEFDQALFQRIKFLAMELRTHNPFFGVLATELWIAGPSKSVPTIGVSEKGSIVYNEDFMRSLEPGEIIAVLVHEALHMALDFWKRFKGLKLQVANWAHDFVINDIIVKSLAEISFTKSNGKHVKLNIKLPPNVLHDLKYRDKSGEEVYLILNKGIQEKAEAAKARFKEMMTDPAQKAEWERKEAINKALRESLVKGFEKLGNAQSLANAKTRTANPELEKRIAEFDDILSDLESISWVNTGVEVDQATNNPHEKEDKPEEPSQPSPEPGEGNEPGEPGQEPQDSQKPEEPSQPQDQTNPQPGQPQDQNSPEAGDQGQQPEADQSARPQDPKDKLKEDMNQSILDYAEKEQQRISDEYDDITPETSQEQNLEDLQKDLDKAADEYVDKVTKHPEDRPAENKQAPEPGEPEQGNEKGDDQGPSQEGGEPGQEGDQSENGNEPGNSGEPGESGPGQEAGKQGQPQPGGEGGEPSAEDGSGDMTNGGGSPGQPGGSQGGSPSQGAGSPSGSGSQGAQSGQSPQGQSQPGNEGGYNGPQKSEANARKDVEDVLSDVKQELANSLSGQKGGTNGLDQRMASGEDMMDQGAYDEAMKEMAKELGVNHLENDIAIDCDDIPGNPYKNETPEQTDARKRQSFNRAIQEDMLAPNKMMGTLPSWLQKDINDILYPPLGFTRKMKKYFGNYGRETKKTFSKPNNRNTFMPGHMMRKGLVRNEAKMFVIQDTSYSMMQGKDLDNLKKSMGLIERLANNQGMEIVVIQCDVGVTARMNTREAMEMINKKQFKLNGLGGSDFTPAFEMIWQEMAKENTGKGHMICAFTDGAIRVPEKPPRGLRQHVLWLTNPGQTAPTKEWGEHVIMDDI
ncbi:DUF2201 family putative metallopeptidase [Pseudomonas sp. PLMAX]|uniref:DUF2201 family putative metallopeptidase n=1 Tax=Pseudomonas sp. PLMAX TaxID=2201998 RepID=UPI0038BCF91F